MHAKNEGAYIAHDWLSILDKLLVDIPTEYICKYVQFVVNSWIKYSWDVHFIHACPMINHKNMKPL